MIVISGILSPDYARIKVGFLGIIPSKTLRAHQKTFTKFLRLCKGLSMSHPLRAEQTADQDK